jgi:asparagine synthase (glutamine-hydrolysing)
MNNKQLEQYKQVRFVSRKNEYKYKFKETLNGNCYHLLELLDDEVRKLIEDKKVAILLSGGIDSSVVTALAEMNTLNIKIFTTSFPNSIVEPDIKYAKQIIKELKLKSENTVITPEMIKKNLKKAVKTMKYPNADPTYIVRYIMANKIAKQGYDIILTGDGADELFGGYAQWKFMCWINTIRNIHLARHIVPWIAENFFWIVEKIYPLARETGKVPMISRLKLALLEWNHAKQYLAVIGTKHLPNSDYYKEMKTLNKIGLNNHELRNAMAEYDFNIIVPNYYATQWGDIGKIKVASPYLCKEVIDYAFKLKLNQRINKKILRDAGKLILPNRITNRKKQPWQVPVQSWVEKIYGLKQMTLYYARISWSELIEETWKKMKR